MTARLPRRAFRSALAALVAAPLIPSASLAQTAPAGDEEDGLNGTQRDEVMQLIESWLVNNPDVLMRALSRLGAGGTRTPPDGNIDAILAAAPAAARAAFEDPSRGAATVATPGAGDATLVVAFDYACPYCRTVAPRLDELLRRRPGIRLVLREMPILTRESEMAARIGVAVARQGARRHLAYHQALMRRRGPLNERTILGAAAAAGADLTRVASDAADPAIARALDDNKSLMRALGILATPMIASGGRIISGSPGIVEIEALLASGGGTR